MPTGQISSTAARGGYSFNDRLSSEFYKQAQSQMKMAQFARKKVDFKLHQGQVMNFDKVFRVNSAGGSLTEGQRFNKTYFTIGQGSLTIGMWGNAIQMTEYVDDISQISIKTNGIEQLKDDAARTKDTALEAVLTTCPWRYSASGTAAGEFTSNGTASGTSSSPFNAYHCRKMVNELRRNNAPTTMGGGYWGILTVMAHDGLYADIESLSKYTTMDNAAKGEVGRYYNTRFVVETNAMSEDIGDTTYEIGEAYIFGKEGVVQEGTAKPMHLRFDDGEFQTDQYIAWLEYTGYALIWATADAQCHVIKYDSL